MQKENGYKPWAPFKDIDEWELSQWSMQRGLTQNATDKYLKLPIISPISMQIWKCIYQIHATLFRHGNKQAFYKHIDTLLHGPKWDCEPFKIIGDELDEKNQQRSKIIYLWKCNPVECIKDLIGNPTFWNNLHYTPEKVYKDSEGNSCVFNEMWTGDW